MPLTLSDVIDEPEATQLPEESDYDEDEISNVEVSTPANKQDESDGIKNELAVPEIEKILQASPGRVDDLAKNLSLFDEEEEMDESHQPKDNREEKELDTASNKNLTPLKGRFTSQYTQSPLPNAEFAILQQQVEEEEEAFANDHSPSFEMPFSTQQSQAMFSSKQNQSLVPSVASLKSVSPKMKSPSPTEKKSAVDDVVSDSYSDSSLEEEDEEKEEDDDEEFADHPDPLRLDQISDQKLSRKDINRLKWWSYLIVLDKNDSTTWKLPYRDGLGRLNRPLLARARFTLTDQTLCSDMGLVLSKSILAVAKRSFELCWPGQPVRLVRALDDNDEDDVNDEQVPMNPIQSTRSVLDEAKALQKKLEKTSLSSTATSGDNNTKSKRSAAENGQQQSKVIEVESDVAPNLVMKIRERRRMALLGGTGGDGTNNNRPSTTFSTTSGGVMYPRQAASVTNRFGINRVGMATAFPGTGLGQARVIVGRKPTLNETKFQLLAAAKRKLAEVRQIKRQTDGEVDQGIVLTNPLTGQLIEPTDVEESAKKPEGEGEESDGDWTPEKGKDASDSESDTESEDPTSSNGESSEGEEEDDDEHKLDVDVVDEEEMGDQQPTLPLESSQELASSTQSIQEDQKSTKIKEHKTTKTNGEGAAILIPETQEDDEEGAVCATQQQNQQQSELQLAIESSQEVFDPSTTSTLNKNKSDDEDDEDDEVDADEEGKDDKNDSNSDNDEDSDGDDSHSKQSESSSQASSKENVESNDNKKEKKRNKKEDRNAQYRALLEQEARIAKRTKRSQYVENEAEEEEEEEQVGVYSIKEKVIGMKSDDDEEDEEVNENDLLRPTEDDLKHIVDTNSDDEGDNKAAQDLFQKQLDEKDEQMLKRVQRDLENHTFLNRRRKLLASGLEKALNDDDSDDETDEEIELAREKRFEEEMKKRMKEVQDQQMQGGGGRKRVILGETIEEIELEQEQTKRFLEMARKLKRSASIPTPYPQATSASSLLFGNKLQSSSILASVELDEDSKTVFECLRTSSSQPIMLEHEPASSMMTIETHSQSVIPIQRESSLPAFFSTNGVRRHNSNSTTTSSKCSFLGISSRSTASSMTSNFVYTKRVKSIAPSMMDDDDETARPPSEETTTNVSSTHSKSIKTSASRVMPTLTVGTKRRVPLVPANKLPSAKLLALTSTVEPSSSSSSSRRM